MAGEKRRKNVTARIWVAAAAAFCCCAAVQRPAESGEPARAGAGGPRIGVVDVSRVFQAYARVKDVSDRMQKIYGEKEKALVDREKRLKDWESRLKLDTRGKDDPEFFEELQRFERERFLLKRDYKRLADEVEDQKTAEMRHVLNDIRNAISKAAEEMDLDLVVKAMEYEDTEVEQARTAEELVRRFRSNSVLYHAQKLDITKRVIDVLNSEYRRSKDGGAKEGRARGGGPEAAGAESGGGGGGEGSEAAAGAKEGAGAEGEGVARAGEGGEGGGGPVRG
ncbi:MAG: OmpH family outer membrane protein [Planctomycetota bacterium]|nr:OmpH family outer membrane protein [Planctomycetota bacterium]